MAVSCAAVTGIGGWNLRVDTSNCPGNAPVNCGVGLQVRCCPSGSTCAGNSSNICCPNGSDCANTIVNDAICADPSWTLWQKPGTISSSNGAWCCQSGYSGLYTSGGVMCLAAGSVPSGASVAVQTTQTSTCSTSSTSTRTSSLSTVISSSAMITGSLSSSTSSSNTAQATSTASSSPYTTGPSRGSTLYIGLGIGLGILAILVIVALVYIVLRRRKKSDEKDISSSSSEQVPLGRSHAEYYTPYKDNNSTSRDRKGGVQSVVELYGDTGNINETHELESTSHAYARSQPGRAELP